MGCIYSCAILRYFKAISDIFKTLFWNFACFKRTFLLTNAISSLNFSLVKKV
jgi:hypothetical protein